MRFGIVAFGERQRQREMHFPQVALVRQHLQSGKSEEKAAEAHLGHRTAWTYPPL